MDLFKEYKRPYKSVFILISHSVSDFRVALAGRWLKKWGYHVEIADSIAAWQGTHFDVTICSRPNAEICLILDTWIKAGRNVIIDMDDDFMAIPPENPAYQFIGAGKQGYHKILLNTIKNATKLVTTAPELAMRYGRETVIIPNCWDEENKLWGRKQKRETVNIGWIGTTTHKMDFEIVRTVLHEILEEQPMAKLVIGLDFEIYRAFETVPEHQKLFIPGMSYEEYPNFYYYCDIILAPLLDTYFNRAKSDIKLVEAGAAGLSWVASQIPFYERWGGGKGGGGYIAHNRDEWKNLITFLIVNKGARESIGMEGNLVSQSRTSELMAKEWQILIESL